MDIVERLKRVKYTRERNDAPNGFSWDEPCDADDYGAEQRFVNPDGPEAADEIERLREDKLDALAAVESENAFYQEEIERLRDLGLTMRNAQKKYFKERTQENLIASKQAEKAFDDALKEGE